MQFFMFVCGIDTLVATVMETIFEFLCYFTCPAWKTASHDQLLMHGQPKATLFLFLYRC